MSVVVSNFPAPPAVVAEATGSGRRGSIESLDPFSHPHWDDWVADHPEASVFHSAGWARVLQDTYGHRPHYVGRGAGGSLAGLAAVMECRVFPRTLRAIALPGADHCPLLSSDDLPAEELVAHLLETGRRRGWRQLEIRGSDPGLGCYPPALSFHGHLLALDRPVDQLFGAFRSCVRRAIRKAEREGVRLEFHQDLDSVRDYYRLHCLTRRRHGLPPQPFTFFRRIHQHLIARGAGFVVLARWQDRPVAGAVILHFGRKAIYKFAASDWNYQQLRGNDLVVWGAIQRLGGRYDSLDFGRTSLSHEGLRRFKLGFGTREVTCRYHCYDFHAGAFVMTPDWASGLHNRVFEMMPVPLLRVVGNLLYRNLGVGLTVDTLRHCVLES